MRHTISGTTLTDVIRCALLVSVFALVSLAQGGGNALLYNERFQSDTSRQVITNAACPDALDVPPNDKIADAKKIEGPQGAEPARNVNATKDSGEPNHAGNPGGASIWYRWTPEASGKVYFSTRDSVHVETPDPLVTLLAVYTVSGSTYTPVISNNNSRTSIVFFQATAGVTYFVAVDGYRDASHSADQGDVVLRWQYPTNNDRFEEPQSLLGPSGIWIDGNRGATKQGNEPNHADSSKGKSVWFRWRAPSTGPFTFNTSFSDFDSVLAAYVGSSFATLREVARSESGDGIHLTHNTMRLQATEGVEYRIAIDSYGGNDSSRPHFEFDSGQIQLGWAPLPPNDDAQQAQPIPESGRVSGTNLGATAESFESGYGGVASVWYKWQAPVSGSFRFTTLGSNYDTLLRLYTGFPSLLNVAKTLDDDSTGTSSTIIYNVTQGEQYYIVIDGKGFGQHVLSWAESVSNDIFSSSRDISNSTTTNGTNIGAKEESGETDLTDSGASVWYRWMAPTSGLFSFTTTGSDFDSLITAYTGTTISSLKPVSATFNGARFLLSFNAAANQVYRIRVSSKQRTRSRSDGFPGNFQLKWGPGSGITNDLNAGPVEDQLDPRVAGAVGSVISGTAKVYRCPNTFTPRSDPEKTLIVLVGDQVEAVETGTDGAFSFQNLKKGKTYRVLAYTLDGTLFLGSSSFLSLSDDFSSIVFEETSRFACPCHAPPGVFFIKGKVSLPDGGTPVAGVEIRFIGGGGVFDNLLPTKTNSQGIFQTNEQVNPKAAYEVMLVDHPLYDFKPKYTDVNEGFDADQGSRLSYVAIKKPTPTADAGADQTRCRIGTGETVFQLDATAANGTPSWSVVSMTTGAPPKIDSPNSEDTQVRVSGTGSVTLRLTVSAPGLPSATAQVTLSVSSAPSQAITSGQVLQGALTQNTCRVDRSGETAAAIYYSFSGTAGQQVAFLLGSSQFDAFLRLLNANGVVVQSDNDSGGGTNARVPASGFFSLPVTGTYYIEISARNGTQTGNYEISFLKACSYSISPSAPQTVQASASSGGTLTVTTGSGCDWTTTVEGSFIHITSGGSGNASGTVTYSIDSNTGPMRSGWIRVQGQGQSPELVINQLSGCTYNVSAPNPQSFTAEGGTGKVDVSTSSGCSWTATSNAPFIVITSPTVSGNGTVNFRVDPNLLLSPRSGTITVANQTLTVSQGAATPATPASLEFIARNRDLVGKGDNARADGVPDGVFMVTLPVGGPYNIKGLKLTRDGSSDVWDTTVPSPYWLLGVALTQDGPLENLADGSVNFARNGGGIFFIFGADAGDLFSRGSRFTLQMTLASGALQAGPRQIDGIEVQLAFEGKTRNLVGKDELVQKDNLSDGAFVVTLPANIGAQSIIELSLTDEGSSKWDTTKGNGSWLLGVTRQPTTDLINDPQNGSVDFVVNGGESFYLYASDSGNLFTAGKVFKLKISFRNAPGSGQTTITLLAFGGKSRDVVGTGPNARGSGTGDKDGTFLVTLPAAMSGKRITGLVLALTSGNGVWYTGPSGSWLLGAATTADGALVNDAQGRVNFTAVGGGFYIFAADNGGAFAPGKGFRLDITFENEAVPVTALTRVTGYSAQLDFAGKTRDVVGPGPNLRGNGSGDTDGAFKVTLPAEISDKRITGLVLTSAAGGIWHTQPNNLWLLGAATSATGSLVNDGQGQVSFFAGPGGVFYVFAADNGNAFATGREFTLQIDIEGGDQAVAKVTIPTGAAIAGRAQERTSDSHHVDCPQCRDFPLDRRARKALEERSC